MTKKTEEPIPSPGGAGSIRELTMLDRMHIESAELSDRLGSLNSFIASTGFTDVDSVERERLQGQRTAMSHYLEILQARILWHIERGDK